MRIFLVWTLFPGSWAVTGPAQVTAEPGGSLAVSCSYELGYELYPKYWCRPGFLWFCFTNITQTNGSEVMVTQGRVSIRDNHASRSFTVTLGDVTPGDAGWHSCGVRRHLWFSLWHSTKVMVSTAVATTTEGSNMSPLATKALCPTGCEEPPVL
ncbi:PREDICTED: CMRF35-like molecule 6, partial [Pterocles gutturalis]